MDSMPDRYDLGPAAPAVFRDVFLSGGGAARVDAAAGVWSTLSSNSVLDRASSSRRSASRSMMFVPFVVPRRDARRDDARLAASRSRYEESDLDLALELGRAARRPRSTTRGSSASCSAAPRPRRRSSSSATASSWSAATGSIRLWNPAAARITGLAESDVVGRPAGAALAGWPLEPGERAPADLPLRGRRGELWLSLTAAEFPHGTVYAFRDLTEERAVEQLRSDFVSTVSHELRTPLAAIYGAAMTLRREDVVLGREQEAGMLEVIAGESERLARIVNDILLASRLDSGAATVSIGRTERDRAARAA